MASKVAKMHHRFASMPLSNSSPSSAHSEAKIKATVIASETPKAIAKTPPTRLPDNCSQNSAPCAPFPCREKKHRDTTSWHAHLCAPATVHPGSVVPRHKSGLATDKLGLQLKHTCHTRCPRAPRSQCSTARQSPWAGAQEEGCGKQAQPRNDLGFRFTSPW